MSRAQHGHDDTCTLLLRTLRMILMYRLVIKTAVVCFFGRYTTIELKGLITSCGAVSAVIHTFVAICSWNMVMHGMHSGVNSWVYLKTSKQVARYGVRNEVHICYPQRCRAVASSRTGLLYTFINLSLIHIWRCRRSTLCRSRWSPYH